jgi:NADH-quinone oxidoreductase subunit N
VVATIWMRPPVAAPVPVSAGPGELAPIAGGSLEADEWEEGPGGAGAALAYPEVVLVAVAFAAATIFFGIFPSPLFDLAAHAGNAISGLF